MGQEGPSIIQKSNKRNKLNQECYCQKVVYFSQEESGNHQRNETRRTTESRMILPESRLFHGPRRKVH